MRTRERRGRDEDAKRRARHCGIARAVCPPDSGDFGSSLESREPRAPLSSTSWAWLGRVSMSRRARARRRDARAGTTNQNGYSLFVSVTPPRHHFRLRDGGPPRQPTRWVLTRLITLCCVIPGLLPRRRVRPRTRNGPDGESCSTPQTMTAKIPPGGPDAPSATRSSPAPTSPTRIASSRGLSSVSARRSCSISTALGSAASRASTRALAPAGSACAGLYSRLAHLHNCHMQPPPSGVPGRPGASLCVCADGQRQASCARAPPHRIPATEARQGAEQRSVGASPKHPACGELARDEALRALGQRRLLEGNAESLGGDRR